MILVDTSGLLSALDKSPRYHRDCAAALNEAAPPLLQSPFVLAELDYLLMRHLGAPAQKAKTRNGILLTIAAAQHLRFNDLRSTR